MLYIYNKDAGFVPGTPCRTGARQRAHRYVTPSDVNVWATAQTCKWISLIYLVKPIATQRSHFYGPKQGRKATGVRHFRTNYGGGLPRSLSCGVSLKIIDPKVLVLYPYALPLCCGNNRVPVGPAAPPCRRGRFLFRTIIFPLKQPYFIILFSLSGGSRAGPPTTSCARAQNVDC